MAMTSTGSTSRQVTETVEDIPTGVELVVAELVETSKRRAGKNNDFGRLKRQRIQRVIKCVIIEQV